MLWRYFRLTTIMSCFLLLLCQSLWSGNELTREKAKEQLVKKYPQEDHAKIFCQLPSPLLGFDISLYKEMEKNELIQLEPSPPGAEYVNVAVLTAKGKKYFIKKSQVNIGPLLFDIYYVKTGVYIFGEITEIENIMPDIAKVKYTVKLSEVSPFGTILRAKEVVINKTANYLLDNGDWKLLWDQGTDE